MSIGLAILLWTLTTMAVCLLIYWGAVGFHVTRTMVLTPTLRAAMKYPALERWPSLCIIIPAHNEERGIGALLESLKKQDYPDFRVVFVLDRCTDRTAEILRSGINGDARFEVLETTSWPEDWVGKVNAMWTGYTQSASAKSADLLLFLDADTVLDPRALSAAVKLLKHRKLSMVSVLSTLTSETWFENLVQPATCMELVRQYPIVRANTEERRRPFANGQFILIERAAYDAIGGHEAVKSEVMEDVYFARHVAAKKYPLGLFLANNVVVCKMYPTWDRFERGWRRIFGECANRKPKRLVEAAWRLRFTGTILPLGAMAALGLGIWTSFTFGGDAPRLAIIFGSLGLAAFFGVVGFTYVFGRTSVFHVPGYIIGGWIVSRILIRAANDLREGNPTLWAGKSYRRTMR